MNWSLNHYNLICFGTSELDVFKRQSGTSKFDQARLFEYTSEDLANRYKDNLAGLAKLPALIVAEADPDREPQTPAFLSQITGVRQRGNQIGFQYQHLSDQLTSEEVFGCRYFDVDADSWEHSRTHWAVKDGNVVSQVFELVALRANKARPRFFDLDAWPLPTSDHIAIMMPFSAEFKPVYNVIKAACDESGYSALRVDEIYGPNKIMNDVFRTIVQGKLVICDLTGKNPNVLYETGLAHACGCDVILLTQNRQDVPFDLGQIRYVTYLPNGEGLEALQEELERHISACLNE